MPDNFQEHDHANDGRRHEQFLEKKIIAQNGDQKAKPRNCHHADGPKPVPLPLFFGSAFPIGKFGVRPCHRYTARLFPGLFDIRCHTGINF